MKNSDQQQGSVSKDLFLNEAQTEQKKDRIQVRSKPAVKKRFRRRVVRKDVHTTADRAGAPRQHDEYLIRQETKRFAGDAGGSQEIYSDRQLILEIRRAVERDSAVSSEAHKILVTAKNGVVILQGTVSSEQEQMIIEDRAVAVAGFGRVVNQMQIFEEIPE